MSYLWHPTSQGLKRRSTIYAGTNPGGVTINHGTDIPAAVAAGVVGLTNPGALTNQAAYTITTPNTTIQNKNFTGRVIVQADNVSFVNCRFNGDGSISLIFNSYDTPSLNCVITNCEFDGKNVTESGINGSKITVVRCVFKGCMKDLHINDDITVIESMMNSHWNAPGTGHRECVLRNGGSNLTLQRCYFAYEINSDYVSSAISAYEQPNCNGFIVDSCYIDGNGGYALYAGGNGGNTTNVKITNNIFGRTYERYGGYAGPVDFTGMNTPGWVFTNNTWGAYGVAPNTDPAPGTLVATW